ncbi:hypothetical protein [Streptomyces sp. NPDC047972]|uniref:hypothetical protein n=1 Tax=Streptomyces sp. NPDC047972 TaxID=3365493 RepID=UPI003713CD8F
MDIAAYKLGSRHKQALRRVESIADQAAHLVEKKLGETVGPVEIVVTDADGYHESIAAAEWRLLGTRTRSRYTLPPSFAHTTLTTSGTLIVFDAQATPEHEIDPTVVHELVHAAQIGRPGVRDAILAGIRHNHGIEKAGWFKARRQNGIVAAHEREAIRLESLARKLR